MATINLPYGVDNFEKVRTNNCYYIDKTGFIKELLEETFDVNLITRPRRFGKTLAISMLAEFFDIRKDTRAIFYGLEISKSVDFCNQWQNQWPVLFLTLKDINGRTFHKAYGLLKNEISKLCKEHPYLGTSDAVDPDDQAIFLRLKAGTGSDIEVQCALEVSDILFDTISYFDYKEDFYHAFLAGLFSGAGYEVKSNSEQGTGRADIIIRERQHRRAIVIEAKWPKKGSDLEKECREALEQIKLKQYGRNLQIEGFTSVLYYGAAFWGKECLIKGGKG